MKQQTQTDELDARRAIFDREGWNAQTPVTADKSDLWGNVLAHAICWAERAREPGDSVSAAVARERAVAKTEAYTSVLRMLVQKNAAPQANWIRRAVGRFWRNRGR